MNCPRCQKPLITQIVESTEVESCTRCGGMFLEPGALDKIAAPHEGDLEFSTLDDDSFSHDDVHGETACPRCSDVMMNKVEFNIYTEIILDYCTGCRGFWLDGRELERIDEEVRALADASDTETAPAMMWFANFIWSLPR